MFKHGKVYKCKLKCEDCGNGFTGVYQYLEDSNESIYVVYEKKENEETLFYNPSGLSKSYCPKCGFRNLYESHKINLEQYN